MQGTIDAALLCPAVFVGTRIAGTQCAAGPSMARPEHGSRFSRRALGRDDRNGNKA